MAGIAETLAAAARAAVERIFTKQKLRLGLQRPGRGDKRLTVTVEPVLTLPGLFHRAAREHGAEPRRGGFEEVRRVAAGYLDAQAEVAKAAVTRVVTQVITRAEGLVTDEVRDQLRDALKNVLERLGGAVERIVDTEATAARGLAGMEAIGAVSAAAGVQDPVIFWVIVRDGKVCPECRRLHLWDDGVTPRVWRRSEVSATYHVRGGGTPSFLGLHPHCRCEVTTLLPGWGFDADGHVKYIAPGHDEYARQRGLAA